MLFPKRWEETFSSRESRFVLGRDRKLNSSYSAMPVTNELTDYFEYYGITEE